MTTHSRSQMLCLRKQDSLALLPSQRAWQKNTPFFVNCGHQSTHPSISPLKTAPPPPPRSLNMNATLPLPPSSLPMSAPSVRRSPSLSFLRFRSRLGGMQVREATGCPLEHVSIEEKHQGILCRTVTRHAIPCSRGVEEAS